MPEFGTSRAWPPTAGLWRGLPSALVWPPGGGAVAENEEEQAVSQQPVVAAADIFWNRVQDEDGLEQQKRHHPSPQPYHHQ